MSDEHSQQISANVSSIFNNASIIKMYSNLYTTSSTTSEMTTELKELFCVETDHHKRQKAG